MITSAASVRLMGSEAPVLSIRLMRDSCPSSRARTSRLRLLMVKLLLMSRLMLDRESCRYWISMFGIISLERALVSVVILRSFYILLHTLLFDMYFTINFDLKKQMDS